MSGNFLSLQVGNILMIVWVYESYTLSLTGDVGIWC